MPLCVPLMFPVCHTPGGTESPGTYVALDRGTASGPLQSRPIQAIVAFGSHCRRVARNRNSLVRQAGQVMASDGGSAHPERAPGSVAHKAMRQCGVTAW